MSLSSPPLQTLLQNAASHSPSHRSLLEQALQQQHESWLQGTKTPVEQYLTAYPDLLQRDSALELILQELFLRIEAGENPTLEEYQQRFPETAELLIPWFAIVDRDHYSADNGSPTRRLTPASPHYGSQRSWPRIDDYEILEELGQGGMGVVYKAQQKGLNRLVALKMIRPQDHDDPEALIRFQIEAEAIARLSHPNIVDIYAQGTLRVRGEIPSPYFVLEYVSAGNLRELWNHSPQPPNEIAQLIAKLAHAMHCAHQQGIIHRDLKPANVLLTEENEPKITDFGLARFFDQQSGLPQASSPTRLGVIIGTPEYISPEQVAGTMVLSPAVDVYALGVMMYEALTGRCPFEGVTALDTLEQVRHREPISPRQLQPSLPVDLETICLKCLNKEPGKRYSSAEALAEDLTCFLEHRPILARRASLLEKAWRWYRRNPLIAFTLGTILTLFATTLILVLKSSWNAQQAREIAESKTRQERWGRYRSNLLAASSALQLNNWSAANRILAEAPREHRDWAWRHFISQLDGAEILIDSDRNGAPNVAINPVRDEMVLGMSSGELRWLDLSTGKVTASRHEHKSPVWKLTFSADGEWLATGDGKGEIRLWNKDPTKEPKVLRGMKDRVYELHFDQKGSRLLGRAGPSGYCLWEVPSGKLLFRDLDNISTGFVLTPDLSELVLFDKGQLCRMSIENPKQTPVMVPGPQPKPRGLVLDPRTQRLLYTTFPPNNGLCLRDLKTGEHSRWMTGHTNVIHHATFSPDGNLIASASADQTVRLWEAKSNRFLNTLKGHTGAVQHVSFSPSGDRLASVSHDGTARLWDPQTGACLGILGGHTGPIHEAYFSRGGKKLITRSTDGTVRIWDVNQCVAAAFRGHESYVYDVAVSPDGKQIASVAWDGKLILWDASTRQRIRTMSHKFPIVSTVSWNQSGTQLATLSRDFQDLKGREVTVWDASNGAVIRSFHLETSTYQDGQASFHPTRPLIAVGSTRGKVLILNVEDGSRPAILDGGPANVRSLCFHPGGKLLASGVAGGEVTIWNLKQWKKVAVLKGHTQDVIRLQYSPTGNVLASASDDQQVCLWDSATNKKIAVLPHGCSVFGLAFHPKDSLLATGCADRTIRLWNVTEKQQIAELHGHESYVHSLQFTPDGTQLISGSGDYLIRVWDTLSPRERAKKNSPSPP